MTEIARGLGGNGINGQAETRLGICLGHAYKLQGMYVARNIASVAKYAHGHWHGGGALALYGVLTYP